MNQLLTSIYPNITVIMLTRLLNKVNPNRIDIESPEDAINEVLNNHFSADDGKQEEENVENEHLHLLTSSIHRV